MILSLLGKNPELLKGVAEYSKEGIDVLAAVIMQFENGVRASFNCGMNFEADADRRMDRLYIHGSKGYIKSETEYNEAGELKYRVCVDGKEEVKSVSVPHNYKHEIEQLGRCILDGEKPFVTEEFSCMNAQMLDMVLEAIGY